MNFFQFFLISLSFLFQFCLIALTSLNPAFGLGGERVVVSGTYFINSSEISVMFGDQRSKATFIDNSTVVSCKHEDIFSLCCYWLMCVCVCIDMSVDCDSRPARTKRQNCGRCTFLCWQTLHKQHSPICLHQYVTFQYIDCDMKL